MLVQVHVPAAPAPPICGVHAAGKLEASGIRVLAVGKPQRRVVEAAEVVVVVEVGGMTPFSVTWYGPVAPATSEVTSMR